MAKCDAMDFDVLYQTCCLCNRDLEILVLIGLNNVESCYVAVWKFGQGTLQLLTNMREAY
jgi:hypothetical protein